MKKQFFRVKQLADQTFSRAGKTEALSEDLIVAEKRIEVLNKVCQNVGRKISSSLLGSGQDAASREKRITKSTEYILAEALNEICQGDVDDILKDILVECSKIQMCLAQSSVETDVRIESSVLMPLQEIIETDVPNIMKQKSHLKRLILDMDSAKNRYQAALKHTSNSNSTGSTAKADLIKDELEDIEMKVEQCRDSLACDMFQLVSKQALLANVLLEYVKLQQTVHRAALSVLDEMVPELESKIENSALKPVFRFPLQEHLRVTNRKIAYPLELCVCVLSELGMEEEGLFRITGGTSKIRRLKHGFDVGFITMETAMEYRDVHVFTSVLKSYFRELPEPLLTYALYDEWLNTNRYHDENSRMSALWTVLHQLPQANFDNLRYFIKFLSVLTKNQEMNKMTPQNLAIVMAPNLIWSPNMSTSNIGENMTLVNQYSSIVECLVKHADWFFPGDEPFYLTLEEANTVTKRHHRSSSADMNLLNVEYTSTTESSSIKRCQSITSLDDQMQNCTNCSPQPESPKPITRIRKNKPAPTPPSPASSNVSPAGSSQPTATVTISTSSPVKTPSSKDIPRSGSVKLSVQHSPKKLTYDICNTASGENSSVMRRQSFTYVDYVERTNVVDKEEKAKPVQSRSMPAEDLSLETGKVSTADSTNKIESRKLVKPVPAPRISLEIQSRAAGGEDEPPRKPIIPEKPTTLPRPGSSHFKGIRMSDPSDVVKIDIEKGKGPSLEKAHLYTVDKQQVSFIDIASNLDDSNALETSQENTTCRSRTSTTSSITTTVEKTEVPLQSERVDRGQNSSHTRAFSDGHNIDVSGAATLPAHRNYVRIQRPMPPPPPPPVVGKPPTRPGSVSDSTNL